MKTLLYQAPFTRIAWTGGCRPPKPSKCSRDFCGVQKALFGEQIEYWRAAWHDEPNWDTLRTYFNRARHDAHATLRP